MSDVYNKNAPTLIERGFYPLVIGPGTKQPHEYVPSEGRYRLISGWPHPKRRVETSPQPGAGIGLRCGVQPGGGYVVAIDWDHDDAAIAALDVFPLAVSKTGQRGFTSFYYSDKPVPSKDYTINKVAAVQVLSTGRQTVLPPTIHPVTGQPYSWDTEHTLYGVKPSDLPRLPENYIELIEGILRPLGYEPEPEGPKTNGHDADAGDNPFRELNKVALRNMIKWVPDLGLYNCRRRSGPTASYEAVAAWRPSTQGRPLEERERNLKVSGLGIKDFGNGETFSALDLVMRARDCSLSDAVMWLSERVMPDDGKVQVDFDAIIDAPGIQPEAEPEKPEAPDGPKTGPEEAPSGEPTPPPGIKVWHLGDPIPPRPAMLVPGLVPAGPVVCFIGGQWGGGKSFVADALTAAVVTGGTFIGEPAVQGGALLIELEASDTVARLYAAIGQGEAQKLPLVFVEEQPPNIQLNARTANPLFLKWMKSLIDYAKKRSIWHGAVLRLVVIDCLTRVAGFEDENNPSECQRVMNVLIEVAKYAGCPVVIVDHFGKHAGAGLRGGSPKETNAAAILETGEKPKNTFDRRHIGIRKMRNGRDGMGTSFWLEEAEVEVDQQVETPEGIRVERQTIKTLRIRWGGNMRPHGAEDEDGDDDNETSMQQKRALDVLAEMLRRHGKPLPKECEAPEGLMGVQHDAWREKLISKRVIEGNVRAAFSRLRNALLDRKQIDVGGGYVWVPLPQP